MKNRRCHSFGGFSVGAGAKAARTDFASLLALQYLTPFVLRTSDPMAITALETAQASLATQFAEDQIDTANKARDGSLHYSDQWLIDRADYLNVLDQTNAADTDNVPVPGRRVTIYSAPGHSDIGTAPSDGNVPADANHIAFDADSVNEWGDVIFNTNQYQEGQENPSVGNDETWRLAA